MIVTSHVPPTTTVKPLVNAIFSRYFPSGASVAICPRLVPDADVLSYAVTVPPLVFNEMLSRTP
jgi:hypothetical protein